MPLEDGFPRDGETPSETVLVDRIRAGDPAAFEALYRAVRNYLYLAVRNAACDRLERAAVARRWRQTQADDPCRQALVEESDLAAAVERALAELPPKRAAVCKLRLIDDLSYAQIAGRLGICEKTVETQLARGLQFLRHRLRQRPLARGS